MYGSKDPDPEPEHWLQESRGGEAGGGEAT